MRAMPDYLLPLLFIAPLFVLLIIAYSIWHAYQLHRVIHGHAPLVPSPRFSNFMCTLMLPDTFRAKAALLAGQPEAVRADVARRVRQMRIGIGAGAALIILAAIAILATSART